MKHGAASEDLHTPPVNRKKRRFWESWKRRERCIAVPLNKSVVYQVESLEPRILLSGDPLLVPVGEDLVSPLVEEPISEVQVQEQPVVAADFSLTTRSLDVDQDGEVTVEEDATLILRHLFGLRGQALVDGAVDTVNGLRQDATAITEFLTKSETTMLDPDANGTADVMSDGLTIFRYITLITEGGLTVDDMANGVVDLVDGKRTDPIAIKAYLDGFLPGMDEIAPVIMAELLNDTGAEDTDILTFDPTIEGLIEDKNPIVRFEASIDGGGFQNAFAFLQGDGTFELSPAFLDSLQGSSLLDGLHTVGLFAEDDHANVSSPIFVDFLLDTTPPEVTTILPGDGVHADFCFRDVELNFNERMDESTLTADTIQLFNAGDILNPIIPVDIQFSNDGQQVFLRYDLFDPGDYHLQLDGSVIADYAGNTLGGTATSDFVVDGPTAVWANSNGGFWDDPDNWVGGGAPWSR